MLDRIRVDYEQNRQPETLQEATKHLVRLTGGKYARIWTPIADDILLVDTADGQTLPVDVLSRGTREQLFVSLRLALVAAYARRGIHLPMILDDVLVNFDAGRAQVAASVLAEFAKEGHQLLVFTCHEHVWRMFQQIKVDSRRLPNRFQEEDANELVVEQEVQLEDPVVEPIVEPVALAPPEPEPLDIAPDPVDELNLALQEEELPEEEPAVEEPAAEYDLADAEPEPAEEELPSAAVEVEYSWSE